MLHCGAIVDEWDWDEMGWTSGWVMMIICWAIILPALNADYHLIMISPVYVALLHLNMCREINHFHLIRKD